MRVEFETDSAQTEGSVRLNDGRVLNFKIDEAPFKVGDKVRARSYSPATQKMVTHLDYTVLLIHALDSQYNRQWAVVAFKGDIPHIVNIHDLQPADDNT